METKLDENEYIFLWYGAKICYFHSRPETWDVVENFYQEYGLPNPEWKRFQKAYDDYNIHDDKIAIRRRELINKLC